MKQRFLKHSQINVFFRSQIIIFFPRGIISHKTLKVKSWPPRFFFFFFVYIVILIITDGTESLATQKNCVSTKSPHIYTRGSVETTTFWQLKMFQVISSVEPPILPNAGMVAGETPDQDWCGRDGWPAPCLPLGAPFRTSSFWKHSPQWSSLLSVVASVLDQTKLQTRNLLWRIQTKIRKG